MRNLEKRLAQLEVRRQQAISARRPKIALTELYRLFDQRRAAGQPLFACQSKNGSSL